MQPRVLPEGWPRLLGRAGLAFAALALLCSLAAEPFAEAHRAGCGLLVRGLGLAAAVEVRPAVGRAPGARLLLRGPRATAAVELTLGTWTFACAPTLVAFALAFAAGGRRGDLAAALAAGLGWAAFSAAIALLRTWHQLPGVVTPRGWSLAVELAYRTAVNPPASEYVAPALAWLLLATLRGRRGAPPHPAKGRAAGTPADDTRTLQRRRAKAMRRADAPGMPRHVEKR